MINASGILLASFEKSSIAVQSSRFLNLKSPLTNTSKGFFCWEVKGKFVLNTEGTDNILEPSYCRTIFRRAVSQQQCKKFNQFLVKQFILYSPSNPTRTHFNLISCYKRFIVMNHIVTTICRPLEPDDLILTEGIYTV